MKTEFSAWISHDFSQKLNSSLNKKSRKLKGLGVSHDKVLLMHSYETGEALYLLT